MTSTTYKDKRNSQQISADAVSGTPSDNISSDVIYDGRYQVHEPFEPEEIQELEKILDTEMPVAAHGSKYEDLEYFKNGISTSQKTFQLDGTDDSTHGIQCLSPLCTANSGCRLSSKLCSGIKSQTGQEDGRAADILNQAPDYSGCQADTIEELHGKVSDKIIKQPSFAQDWPPKWTPCNQQAPPIYVQLSRDNSPSGQSHTQECLQQLHMPDSKIIKLKYASRSRLEQNLGFEIGLDTAYYPEKAASESMEEETSTSDSFRQFSDTSIEMTDINMLPRDPSASLDSAATDTFEEHKTLYTSITAATSCEPSSPQEEAPVNKMYSQKERDHSVKKVESVPTSTTTKSPPIHDPVFAKRAAITEDNTPSDMEHDVYAAWLRHVPDPKNLICICKKPARTYEVQLVECSGPKCSIRWFHRNCLDKSRKLQIRYGTMLCVLCRDEKDFSALAREKDWSIDRLVEEETKMAFSAKEIIGSLSGLSNTDRTENAYSLSLQHHVMDTEPVAAEKDERLLGSLLQIGYVQSRPQQFAEAYGNAKANRTMADEEYDYNMQIDKNTNDEENGIQEEEGEIEADEEEEGEEIDELTGEAEQAMDSTTHWRGAEIVHAI